jgi:hypothetical protein
VDVKLFDPFSRFVPYFARLQRNLKIRGIVSSCSNEVPCPAEASKLQRSPAGGVTLYDRYASVLTGARARRFIVEIDDDDAVTEAAQIVNHAAPGCAETAHNGVIAALVRKSNTHIPAEVNQEQFSGREDRHSWQEALRNNKRPWILIKRKIATTTNKIE